MINTGVLLKCDTGNGTKAFRVIGRPNPESLILFEIPNEDHVDATAIKIIGLSRYQVEHDIEQKKAVVVEDIYLPASQDEMDLENENFENEPAKEVIAADKLRDTAYKVISWIWSHGPQDLVGRKSRGRLISDASKRFDQRPRTIRKWLFRFLKYGLVPDALYPRFYNCGGRGSMREPGEQKRGRRPKYDVGGGCNIDSETRKQIRSHFVANLPNMKSVKESHDKYCKVHCVDGMEVAPNGSVYPRQLPSHLIPSFSSYEKYSKIDSNPATDSILRYGEKEHAKLHRERTGNEAARTFGPGSVFQIDFTRADIYVVHSVTGDIIGRPTLGLMVDVWSGMPAGLLVTMANPSSLQAMLLCENAFSDKKRFCEDYGVKDFDWPVHHLPAKVLADRGELRGKTAERLSMGLGVTPVNTAPWRAEQKGTIESHLGHITRNTIHLLPGASPRLRERGDPACQLDGILDLPALIEILIRAIRSRANDWIDKHHLPLEAEADKTDPSPLEMWTWGMLNFAGAPRIAPPADVLRLKLLPTATAQVTPIGLKFRNLYYSDKELFNSGLFVKARNSGNIPVLITYDPRLVDVIYLRESPHDTAIRPCILTGSSGKYLGLSLSYDDVLAIKNDHNKRRIASSHENRQERINDSVCVDEIIDRQKGLNKVRRAGKHVSLGTEIRIRKTEAARQCDKEDARILGNPSTPMTDGKIVPLTVNVLPAVPQPTGTASPLAPKYNSKVAFLRNSLRKVTK